jgi:hypothetical protein
MNLFAFLGLPQSPASFSLLPAATVRGIVAYHVVLARAFAANLPTAATPVPSLLSASLPTAPVLTFSASLGVKGAVNPTYSKITETDIVKETLIKGIGGFLDFVTGGLFGEKEHPLVCWGDGSPIRDFIYAGDVADGIIQAYEGKITQPINLGSGTGVTIKELAETLVEIYEEMYGEKVEINWDPTKPNGDEKRLMSTERAESFGIKQKISLKTGLKHTIDYYLNEYKK